MSKVYTDNIEKRTGGTEMAIPATGKWPTANIADSIITDITANTAKVTNATHTGDVTGATALTIATDAVDIAMLSATGTADATTFLRGDNSWATAGGDNTPAFYAYISSNQSVTQGVITKATFDGEVFDSDSAYDNSTNYRFTVPAGEGGKYLVSVGIAFGNGNNGGKSMTSYIYVNGSQKAYTYWGQGSSIYNLEDPFLLCQTILVLSATDYVEGYGKWNIVSGSPAFAGNNDSNRPSYFHAFKLVGV